MHEQKRMKLEAAGWRSISVNRFLKLDRADTEHIENRRAMDHDTQALPMKTKRSPNRSAPPSDCETDQTSEMKTVTLTEMRYRTKSMLSRLRPGERVVVTKRGKPYAELIVSESPLTDSRH